MPTVRNVNPPHGDEKHANREERKRMSNIFSRGSVIQEAGTHLDHFFLVVEGLVSTVVPQVADLTVPNVLERRVTPAPVTRDIVILGLKDYVMNQESKYGYCASEDSKVFLLDDEYLKEKYYQNKSLEFIKLLIRQSDETSARLRARAIKKFCPVYKAKEPNMDIKTLERRIGQAEKQNPSYTYAGFAQEILGEFLALRRKNLRKARPNA